MKPDSVKKIKAGLYQYTFGNLVFNIVQILDGDKDARVSGKWYFMNADPAVDEGGTDHFRSKAKALAALCEYVPHRKYIKRYGWCYYPYES